jgi:8-oxo-dGTP pyrophosphatase MutT (NUDIX family)
MGELIDRVVARIVILDASDRVLLLRYVRPDDGQSIWITPGGAVDEGESHEAAALRELAEEVGTATGEELSPCVWVREEAFSWAGIRYRQAERFFVMRIDTIDMEPTMPDPGFVEHRWWSLDELEKAGVAVYPTRLSHFVRRLGVEGLPALPIDVGT